jgi:uncharacterized protein (TIGR03437 family)
LTWEEAFDEDEVSMRLPSALFSALFSARFSARAPLLVGLFLWTAHAQTTTTTISMSFDGTVTGVFGSRNEFVQGSGSVAPYGSANLTANSSTFTFTFNAGDTLTGQVQASGAGGGTILANLTIGAGTGLFKGASGTAQLTLTCQSDCAGVTGTAYTAPFTGSGSGTVILPAAQPPALTVAPGIVSFSGQANSAGSLQQSIAVQNSGGGSFTFTASVVSGSPWVSIAPSSGTVAGSVSVLVTVTVSTQALTAGNYRDVIHFSSSAGSADVPVTVLVANSGAILGAGPVGAVFNVVQGAGSSATQTINISNDGSAGSTVNWTAAPATGLGGLNGDFLAIGQNGQVPAGSLGSLTLALNGSAASLGIGVYYELVQISAPAAQNSPQYVTAVLNVEPPSASVLPSFSPAGLLFTGAAGQAIAPQQFTVNWSSVQAQFFQALPATPTGQSWLQVSPFSGSASTANPALIQVSVSTGGLVAGVYSGTVNLAEASGSVLGSVNVTLIVTSGLTAGVRAAVRPQAAVAGCAPKALVLTETGIPDNFSVPAGWPANLVVTMTDDCGNPIEGGAVTANFSNGDAPVALGDQGSGGLYVATWQPSNRSASNMTIAFKGTAGTLTPASSQLSGLVTGNQAPVLSQNGIVNNLNPLAGGALAPGTVAAAYGTGLTTSATGVSPNTVPLLTEFQNTQLVIGGFVAPLYYLSDTQLNIQIPAELATLQQYPAVGVVNGALTLPVSITVVPVSPGVAANLDGSVIAQHSDYTLIDASSPAHPGESIVIYVVGMGATNPAVASGAVAPGLNPGDSLAYANVQPVVMVSSQTAHIQFAGLTPGGIGLYQINFVVPVNVTAGSLSLTVSQGGTNANATTLPVTVP